ncbi:MAG: polysaccharide biosynthesis tyrosine autokinase [Pseudomonadota bacterium]|nr:polysaccharide biosynthesis tyrosine autokinase [Pseudomonadota bacterium]
MPVDDYPGTRRDAPEQSSDLPERLRHAAADMPVRGEDKPDELTFESLFATVWRRKWTVAAFGFGFAILVMALVYTLTPMYKATAVVMLDRQQQQIIDVESVVSGVTTDYFSILAEAQVLRSRALANRVVEAENLEANPYFNPLLLPPEEPGMIGYVIGGAITLLKTAVRGAVTDADDAQPQGRDLLDENYWIRQRAIDRMVGSLDVRSVGDTYVYALTVETPGAILSADLANKVAELYILDQLETKFEATQKATEWLSNRVAELKTELEQSEAAVEAYNSSTTLISEAALAGMNRQLKELRERVVNIRSQETETEARAAQLRQALDARDFAGFAALANQPRLTAMAGDIASAPAGGQARDLLEERFANAAERVVFQVESERDRAASQAAAVTSSIADLEQQLETQTQDLVQLRQLTREAEADRRIYEQFLRRLNETSVQQGVQQADARVLSPAVVNFNPSYPPKMLAVLAAGFFGGLCGIAFVLIVEQMNNSFRSSEELEKGTGLAVLGNIPVAPVRMRRGVLDYAVERPSSALVEAIRNLRTGVLLANVDRQPKMVMLTSSLPKEGKTTCSLLLAQNAAGLGKKVLLVECDLRRRTFRTYFSGAPKHGLMSILSGEKSFDEVVHHDEKVGFDVVMGEETKVNAADVFASQRFRQFLQEARDRYDFIVIDTPPVLAVPDSRVIAPLADAVIYCVRWNSTHKDLVRHGLAQFAQIKVRIAGLALTQINTKKMAKYGYGGYNYYYYKTSSRYYLN